jgi:deazaflavin-dependent oxidoreductase (nitroreductase family)
LRGVFLIAKALHGGAYRASRGRVGGQLMGMPVLMLTTTGRVSGRRRTVPLTYFEDGDALVVVGSKGGSPRHPAWYLNLEAEPEVEVQVGSEHRRLQARRATPEEAERLWPAVLARAPVYGRYRARTTRDIPLVLLERDVGA